MGNSRSAHAAVRMIAIVWVLVEVSPSPREPTSLLIRHLATGADASVRFLMGGDFPVFNQGDVLLYVMSTSITCDRDSNFIRLMSVMETVSTVVIDEYFDSKFGELLLRQGAQDYLDARSAQLTDLKTRLKWASFRYERWCDHWRFATCRCMPPPSQLSWAEILVLQRSRKIWYSMGQCILPTILEIKLMTVISRTALLAVLFLSGSFFATSTRSQEPETKVSKTFTLSREVGTKLAELIHATDMKQAVRLSYDPRDSSRVLVMITTDDQSLVAVRGFVRFLSGATPPMTNSDELRNMREFSHRFGLDKRRGEALFQGNIPDAPVRSKSSASSEENKEVNGSDMV